MNQADSEALAKEFMEEYGDLPTSALPLLVALLHARTQVFISAENISKRLTPEPGPNETMRRVIEKAARLGDAEAKLLLKSGALNLQMRAERGGQDDSQN